MSRLVTLHCSTSSPWKKRKSSIYDHDDLFCDALFLEDDDAVFHTALAFLESDGVISQQSQQNQQGQQNQQNQQELLAAKNEILALKGKAIALEKELTEFKGGWRKNVYVPVRYIPVLLTLSKRRSATVQVPSCCVYYRSQQILTLAVNINTLASTAAPLKFTATHFVR